MIQPVGTLKSPELTRAHIVQYMQCNNFIVRRYCTAVLCYAPLWPLALGSSPVEQPRPERLRDNVRLLLKLLAGPIHIGLYQAVFK